MNDIVPYLVSLWPETPAEWALHLAFGVGLNVWVLSMMEHRIHLNLMHIKAMPKIVYELVPFFSRFQRRHAVEHHGIYYKQFDYEPDEHGRHENIRIRLYQSLLMGLGILPAWLVLLFVSPVAALCFCVLGFAHNTLWGVIHSQMHMPEDVFWRDWALYRFVARHHFLHHMQPTKNLNVVLPGADWIFGTVAKPRLGDVREMLRLGYLHARTERGQRIAQKMAPKPRYTFVREPAAPALAA